MVLIQENSKVYSQLSYKKQYLTWQYRLYSVVLIEYWSQVWANHKRYSNKIVHPLNTQLCIKASSRQTLNTKTPDMKIFRSPKASGSGAWCCMLHHTYGKSGVREILQHNVVADCPMLTAHRNNSQSSSNAFDRLTSSDLPRHRCALRLCLAEKGCITSATRNVGQCPTWWSPCRT